MWTAGCCIGSDPESGKQKVESIAVIGKNLPQNTRTEATEVSKLQHWLANGHGPVELFPGQPACSNPGNSYILKVWSLWDAGDSSCVSNLSQTCDQINNDITRTILYSAYIDRLHVECTSHTPTIDHLLFLFLTQVSSLSLALPLVNPLWKDALCNYVVNTLFLWPSLFDLK